MLEFSVDAGIRPTDESEHFHIAIIYDTTANGHAAMGLCQQLVNKFGSDFLFHIALCELKSFDGAHDKTPAMLSANKSALLILSIDQPLSDRPCEWLETWTSSRGDQPSVVALMGGNRAATNLNRAFLSRFCSAHQIDFIAATEAREAGCCVGEAVLSHDA